MLDTGFAPCYTDNNMVQFKDRALDLKIGDIVLEKPISNQPNAEDMRVYWVITKIVDNDNPIRYKSTYPKLYCAFDLQNEENVVGPIVFRSSEYWEYEVIRYDKR